MDDFVGLCWRRVGLILPRIPRIAETCVDLFQALHMKQNMPDSFALPSLSAIYMKTGDVAYVPAGYMVFEKAITETNLSIRPSNHPE